MIVRKCGSILLFGLLGLVLFVPYSCALSTNASNYLPCINRTVTETHVANLVADTYVINGSGVNYGTDTNLIVGNYADDKYYETYLQFRLSAPNIQWADLTFIYYASKPNTPFSISIYTTPDTWAETTINWTTRPQPATKQTNVTVTPIPSGFLYFKFKCRITSGLNSSMSFRLNATTALDKGYIVGRSKEGANLQAEAPLLEYGVNVTQCVTVPGFDVVLLLSFSGMATYFLFRRFRTRARTLGGQTAPHRRNGP